MSPVKYLEIFLLTFLLIIVILIIIQKIRSINNSKKLYKIPNIEELEKTNQKKFFESSILKKLKLNIEYAFLYRKNKNLIEITYYGILIFIIALAFALFILEQYLLAFIMPLTFFISAYKIIELLAIPKDIVIREELPNLIQQFIKVLSKTDDLAVVMYESSRFVKDPLKSSFQEASRRINNEPFDVVLNNLAKELDNMWIYSFVFILSSLKGSSKKEDIIKNLILLSEIVEKEDRQATKSVVEKKGMIMLNWSLATIAVVMFFIHILATERGSYFFFETIAGKFSLFTGFTLLLGTVIVNLILERKR